MIDINVKEALENFYLHHVFIFDEDASLSFKEVFRLLKYFIPKSDRGGDFDMENASNSSSYRRFFNIFCETAEIKYPGCRFKDAKAKSDKFRLKNITLEEEIKFVMPYASADITSFQEFSNLAHGVGKLQTEMTVPLTFGQGTYLHSGVFTVLETKDILIAEVVHNGLTTFEYRLHSGIGSIGKLSNVKLRVNNLFLKKRFVLDLPKILFRLSVVANKTVSYSIRSLNCDHISTWLMTGDLSWATGNLQAIASLVDHTFEGTLKKADFLEIETYTNF